MRGTRSTILLLAFFAFSLIAIVIGITVGARGPQNTGPDITTITDAQGNLVTVETMRDNEGRVVERKELDKTGKLLKRITYKYLKGFKKPDTSTTNYRPDGKTAHDTVNEDHDPAGNPTITVTTYYDAKGKETYGIKHERDPKTGKVNCYQWNASTQTYAPTTCPEVAEAEAMEILYGGLRPPQPKNTENAKLETVNGLVRVKFDMPAGGIIVNLPDDIRAGDTISGTVVSEPRGSTGEERSTNRDVLNGYVVEVAGQSFPVNKGSVGPFVVRWLEMPARPGMPPGQNSFFDVFVAIDPNNSAAVRARIPLLPSGAAVTPDPKTTPSVVIPPLGQTGRPVVITGPFDGNSSNTTLKGSALRTTVQDFEKNTENVSGGFGLIAESPRKAVFQSPANVVGPMKIILTEGSKQTTESYRNVGVNLTAPKTSLLKGEQTQLRVEVNGLEGIKAPVPLTLESQGVITVEGGVYQPLVIQPSQVGADGSYAITRVITGVQTGGWTTTATVVTKPFDICLQDDSNGNSLVFSSETGDYIFCQSCGAATTSIVLPWIAQSRGPLVQSSDLKLVNPRVTIKPCQITLWHQTPDQHVQAQIDICKHSGSALVQTTSPKVKFTITDRNMADNMCAAR